MRPEPALGVDSHFTLVCYSTPIIQTHLLDLETLGCFLPSCSSITQAWAHLSKGHFNYNIKLFFVMKNHFKITRTSRICKYGVFCMFVAVKAKLFKPEKSLSKTYLGHFTCKINHLSKWSLDGYIRFLWMASKFPQTEELKTIEMSSLSLLEASRAKLKHQHVQIPCKGSEENLALLLWFLMAPGGYWLTPTSAWVFPWASFQNLSAYAYKNIITGFRAHPNSSQSLITIAKIWFPNQVTLGGSQWMWIWRDNTSHNGMGQKCLDE